MLNKQLSLKSSTKSQSSHKTFYSGAENRKRRKQVTQRKNSQDSKEVSTQNEVMSTFTEPQDDDKNSQQSQEH